MPRTYVDLASGEVATARLAGGTTLTLADASAFGEPTPEAPMRLVAYRGEEFLTVLRCEGRTGNDLTLNGAFDNYADAALEVGDSVECVPTAGDFRDLYEALAAISLTPGPQGDPGEDGSGVWSGEGVPSDSLGGDGDLYLDLLTGDVYSREEGVYSKVGNIKGAKGDQGNQGDPGEQGEQGEQGPAGVGSFGLTMPPGFSVANSPLTESGTLAVTTSLSGLLKGTGSGFTVATPEEDYATPAQIESKAEDADVVHLAGSERVAGSKTLVGAKLEGGVTLVDSVGSTLSAFDSDGYGFPRVVTFRLASGVDLVAGSNLVAGGLLPFAGKVAKVQIRAATNGGSGGFSLQVKLNNTTSLFASPYSVAAGVTSVKTTTSFASDAVGAGDWLSLDASSVGAGVQGVEVAVTVLGRNR